jgi:hypothetical protein
MNVIEFGDQYVKTTENGKPFSWSDYQRTVLALMYKRHYMTRLWSEPKKSGKKLFSPLSLLSGRP